jgi:hypothetical protein
METSEGRAELLEENLFVFSNKQILGLHNKKNQ